MSESKNRKKPEYNQEVVNFLKNKYNFKSDYIRKCIRGERNGVIPIRIQEEYNKLEKASRMAMLKKAETLKTVKLEQLWYCLQ